MSVAEPPVEVPTRAARVPGLAFAGGFVALAAGAAALAGALPVEFSLATVFLFAGPHNWFEARYALGRLPARAGKLRGFFALSALGVAGLTVAYAAARAVGSIPLMPGGLLVVEAVLVPGLVSSGMTLAAAISAMLIYRLVSWIFISAIGWVVFFFMFRTETDVDPDAGLDEVDQSEASAMPSPNTTHRSATCRPEPAPSLQFWAQSL